jgi:hypothetical protein
MDGLNSYACLQAKKFEFAAYYELVRRRSGYYQNVKYNFNIVKITLNIYHYDFINLKFKY